MIEYLSIYLTDALLNLEHVMKDTKIYIKSFGIFRCLSLRHECLRQVAQAVTPCCQMRNAPLHWISCPWSLLSPLTSRYLTDLISRIRRQLATPDNFENDACKKVTFSSSVLAGITLGHKRGQDCHKKAISKTAWILAPVRLPTCEIRVALSPSWMQR